jgi:hypothetical protein
LTSQDLWWAKAHREVFSEDILPFSPVSIIPPMLRYTSFVHHGCNVV